MATFDVQLRSPSTTFDVILSGGEDLTGYIKYWTGSEWQLKPMKYWNGTTWIQKPVRYWNGSYWLLTEYGLGANFHPNPLDIFAWSGTAANAGTLSRDTGTGLSPSGGVPLKMAITGNDPHSATYNGATWNLAPAANGQTWFVKAWAKASVATTGEIFIFGVDSSGNCIGNAGTAFSAGGFNIGTSWTEVSFGFKFTDASVAFIQTRLDGTPVSGAGINIWWDDLRVYRVI
jgi:hypothetical protein